MRQHVYQVYNTYIKFRFTCGELDLLQNIVDWFEYSKSVVMFTFCVFDPQKPLWANLVQKIKIVWIS